MRDSAVLAVHAVRITAAEHAAIVAGWRILRPFWPPMVCRGVVVGLHVEGHVVGEALLTCAADPFASGCAWSFGPVTTYTRPLPHPSPRGMSSPMPAAPVGTLTAARDWDAFH